MTNLRIHTQSFDLSVVSLNAIKKAAYVFSASYSVSIVNVDDRMVEVHFESKSVSSHQDVNDFGREVLEYELRESIERETGRVRDVILAQAFSGLNIIFPEGEESDFREDPLQIATARVAKNVQADV